MNHERNGLPHHFLLEQLMLIKTGLAAYLNHTRANARAGGRFQESYRLKLKSYAATFFCFLGLRNTSSTWSQFSIAPPQRSGCRDLAC